MIFLSVSSFFHFKKVKNKLAKQIFSILKGFQLKFGGTRETLIKFAQFFEVLNYTKIITAQSRQEINVFAQTC